VNILERCPYQRGVHIREMSILERFPYERDFHIREEHVVKRALNNAIAVI
jgi:hypothetical protein